MARSKNKRKKPSKKPQAQNVSGEAVSATVTETAPAAKKKAAGPFQFFQQVRAEGQKVTWTSLKETQISTVMVIIMVIIMSMFFFLVDQVWRFIIPKVLSLGALLPF